MSMNGSNMNYEIVPPHLAVKAMRDNGYKNAAYAVAELMDNAIQAGATQVELLCADKTSVLNQRRTTRIHQIAVLDNGSGMSSDVLRMALQFGNGTNLDEEKHTGIGRFGMGLPSSSISQCRRVDVWSWQNGIHSALYTYLDLDEVISGGVREVPEPIFEVLPAIWRQVGEEYGSSGTLVVWSNIDRCLWRRSETLNQKLPNFLLAESIDGFSASVAQIFASSALTSTNHKTLTKLWHALMTHSTLYRTLLVHLIRPTSKKANRCSRNGVSQTSLILLSEGVNTASR